MKRYLINLLILLYIFSSVAAAEPVLENVPTPTEWTMRALPQMTYVSYNGSESRDFVLSYGVDLSAQYLERGGVQIGVSRSVLNLKVSAGSPPAQLSQNNLFLSAHQQLTPDGWDGELTLQADILRAYNDDASNQTNAVSVLAPKVAFLNFAKTYYVDLGVASSSYGVSKTDNSTLSVLQTTPTFGFAFNSGSDWLQVRLFDIRFNTNSVATASANNRVQNLTQTDALELKWMHFLTAEAGMPTRLQFGALLGKRLYAVDGENLYNFSDVQQGGVSLNALWVLSKALQVEVQGGFDQFNAGKSSIDPTKEVLYTGSYLYLGLQNRW